MLNQIKIPNLGESISEAIIAKWYKKEGEQISKDELLLELETEKITLEVNSPSDGVVKKIMKNEQESVEVGEIVGEITENSNIVTESSKQILDRNSVKLSNANSKQQDFSNLDNEKFKDPGPNVRQILNQNNIDPKAVQNPSGKDGRISKIDVMKFLENKNQNQDILPKSDNHSLESKDSRVEYVKLSSLRKTIARRLKESQNTAAILSTFNEIDMHNISELRKEYKDEFQKKHSVKLGFMSFFIKASVEALKQIGSTNAEIREDYIIYKKYYNIAVAVGTENGLVVPVIKDADKLSFAELEQKILDLATKARSGKLAMSDFQNGSFSITNGGIYGSLLSTPIINPPQTAILGMHNIQKRPVVIDNKIEIRPMMYVALSYDHRIIDGKDAVGFLVKIKNLIENPEKLLLNL
ncbi:MAG: 2-oxoglutarate dehydrogenase complex dihydrolipoyllysine-residue succinyltransferase [Rickettsia sp.]|nr:2-oxoglutarate dehydrogenase complex dihydrolipoyllysine-residue succinyltransferase [Rickettsia sp.]